MQSGQESNRNTDALKERIRELLSKMTLKEKTELLVGRDSWNTAAFEHLGIPSIITTDGPHGVRRAQRGTRDDVAATSFPTGVSMASCWNRELVERVGRAIGEETRACGCDIILGPCVNIIRHPLWGRNFESYSEDPYLAGSTGVAYVKGVQSCGVGTSLKHFACNNQEVERMRGNSVVDERTLREIYLAAFEMIVKEADPWTVMCSYNRLNGIYASENRRLLHEILRDEWGYEGVVVSDWGATHSTVEAIKAGMDLEMPGPEKYYGKLLADAVNHWQVDMSEVDRSAARILRMILLSGKMDKVAALPQGSVNTPEHQKIARELAEESITLLKNESNLLPLDKKALKSLAIIGPTANDRVGGDGSSKVTPPYYVTPLEALRARLEGSVEIGYEQGCDNTQEPPIIKSSWLTPSQGSGDGLLAEYFASGDLSGEAALKRIDRRMSIWSFDGNFDESVTSKAFSARWTGKLCVPDTGRHLFQFTHTGSISLYIDGKPVLEHTHERATNEWESLKPSAHVNLVGGFPHDIRLEYRKPDEERHAVVQLTSIYAPLPEEDNRFERAVKLAEKSDAAIVFVGMMEDYEHEGTDTKGMDLKGRQNELVSAIIKANPRTVVVLSTGTPVTMPWINEVPALLETFYFGQEGGNAVADILLGDINPSGKLSMTFPKRLEDTPAFINYPGAREVHYGEGVFVGYRYYDKRDLEPLFPFGAGLSYTTFEYSEVKAPESFSAQDKVTVSVTVRNTGSVYGKEVVQLYVSDTKTSIARPPKELKGFKKVGLNPGESTVVDFVLDRRAFSFYAPYEKLWVAEPGEFEILLGSSSRDIRAKAVINLVE